MASSSKRKRQANPHAAHFEIISPADIVQPTATSRTVTFDRHADGRLGQQTEIAQVEISAEDLAALAQDLEFSSLPDDDTLNLEYFEHSVQQGDNVDVPIIPTKGKEKVKRVRFNGLYLIGHRQHSFLSRTYMRNGYPFETHMSTS